MGLAGAVAETLENKDVITLFARYEHGGHPVRVVGDREGFKVERPEGTETFSSARSLIRSFYGGNDPHMTFDRYFRIGKYARVKVQPTVDLVEMFSSNQPTLTLTKVEPAVEKEPELGIDLAARGHEVEKLMYAGFGSRINRSGFDPQDVLQEVYRGLLARNNGSCPFDIRKSSFGHYVHMVISCVLNNFHRRENRYRDRQQVGIGSYSDGKWVIDDVACSDLASSQADHNDLMTEVGMDECVDDLQHFIRKSQRGQSKEGRLAVEILPLVRRGHTRKEISELMDIPCSHVSKALGYLRAQTREWVTNRA